MPIVYTVALDGALVVELWFGAISVADLYAHRDHQKIDKSIVNGARILADLRSASLQDVSEIQMAAFAGSYRETEAKPAARSLAFVATEGFSKAQAYERASRSFLRSVVVFTNLETACTWLGVDAGRIKKVIDGLRPKSVDQ